MRNNKEIETEISNLEKVMKEIGDRCNCGSAPCNCGAEEDTIAIQATIDTLTWILRNNPASPMNREAVCCRGPRGEFYISEVYKDILGKLGEAREEKMEIYIREPITEDMT